MEQNELEQFEIPEDEPQLPENVYHASNTLQRVIEKKYRKLNLSGRALTDFHLDTIIKDCPHIHTLSSCLWELNISTNNITFVPECIEHIYCLERLILHNNDVKVIPNIRRLALLKLLSLGHNKISTFPKNLEDFANLRALELNHNHLTELPPEIGCLKHLLRLNLCENNIVTLPEEIGDCVSLKELYLNSNKLICLPYRISDLKNLSILSLDGNDWFPSDLEARRVHFQQHFFSVCDLTFKEIISRLVYQQELPLDPNLPTDLVMYFKVPNFCVSCGGVYFGSWIEFISNRIAVKCQRDPVPVGTRVCSRECFEEYTIKNPF